MLTQHDLVEASVRPSKSSINFSGCGPTSIPCRARLLTLVAANAVRTEFLLIDTLGESVYSYV